MREELLHAAVAAARVLASAGIFGVLLLFAASGRRKRLVLQAYEDFSGLVRSTKRYRLAYERVETFLLRRGAAFHYGSRTDPVRFMAVRAAAGGAGLLVGSRAHLFWGILLAFLFYQLPGALLSCLNKRDNEKLLPELKLVYQALSIQIRAGVYLTDALAECYGSVREERLRQALLELSGDIVMKGDLFEALERFQGKFDNRYIDSLCIILLQALESGQAVELLADISEQIKDMEVAVWNRRKNALDRSVTFYQLGILAAVLAAVMYACVTRLFSAAVGF